MLRYNSLRSHYKKLFSYPVLKVCVDAGFTCPNRDGSKGYGGCIYCNERGSGAPYIIPQLSVGEQIDIGIKQLKNHNPDAKFVVYFQAFTNTYGSVDKLEQLYRIGITKEDIIGISIGTRPDCVSPDILDFIAHLSEETYLWLEYGAETIHDRTLKIVNRHHTFSDFLGAYSAAKKRNIRICVHVIIGLPGESEEDIYKTAETIGKLEPDGIKIHSLYIETGTKLYDQYIKNPWKLFSEDEYCVVAARFLEFLPKTTIIHRLVGEALPNRLYAPEWTNRKQQILQKINNKLIEWNSYQGSRYIKTEAAKRNTTE